MTQLSIQIPDELKPFVDQVIADGAFSTESEFITSLLYSVKAESEFDPAQADPAKLALLRQAIGIGVEELRRGQGVEFDAGDIITRGRARLTARLAGHG
jgi:Arc/MetJ-type ribon-helix-helix transcriptional regulator